MPTLLKDLAGLLQGIGLKNVWHAAQYPYRKAWAEARWAPPGGSPKRTARWADFLSRLGNRRAPTAQYWQEPGPIQAFYLTERGAAIETEHATIAIAFLAPDLVRVRAFPPGGEYPPLPYAIAKQDEAWEIPTFEIIETETAVILQSSALSVGLIRDSAAVFWTDAEGRLLRADVDAAWGDEGTLRHRTTLAPDEHIYGLGERATPWNRRGHNHIIWNTDPAGYNNDDDPINLNIPAYVGLHKAGSYLVFYENPMYAEFDLGARTLNVADHRFAGGELRYYFIAGPVPHLIKRYTELTGRHELPPLWMLGYQQSRWSYYPEARLRTLAEDFKRHEVPCDAIHLDIHYMDGYRVFTWDKARFPNPDQLAADLREQGIKLVTIIDPGVKKDPNYAVYREGLQNGYFCTLPNGKPFYGPVWPGICAFPDFTDPKVRTWWGKLYKPLMDAGVAGFWNDMNEPAVFTHRGDHTFPEVVHHNLEGRGGDHREAHNLYGMQMVRASRDGLLRLRPEKRPVIITRAGWAGVQRYATSWTGDNLSSWDSLRLTIPMMMGLGLSGIAFSGSDVGGFSGEADGELFTRWIQLGTFQPFFRAHTVINTSDQEPWSYGEPYLSIVRRFIQLRYELLPYLYTATWQMTAYGWPMVRPLWWEDQENDALWDVDDAFRCGDALLVAPIVKPGAKTRSVTLPKGAWYDFWTNQVHRGGETLEAFAPLEIMPLFIREGTVLPMGEYGPSVEQRVQKFLRLAVYPLTEEGEAYSMLYEDAGEGFAYQHGECRQNRFVMRRGNKQLTLNWEREGAYTPPYEHIELTLQGLKRMPRKVVVDGETYPVVTTDPVRHTALLGVPPFDVLKVIL